MALPSQYLGTSYFSAIPSHPDDDHHLRAIHADPRKDNGRKRPKYTRSKLGCLTCRTKKVKCDEAKPVCTRCIQGQRECTWPEVAPPRRKPNPRSKQGSEERPSTAGSDGRSDSSSPPMTREQSPRSRAAELSLTLHRGDPLLQVSSSASAPAGLRRLSAPMGSYYPPSHQFSPSSDSPLHSIPELQHPYSQQNNNTLIHPNHHHHIPPPPSFFSNSSNGSYSHASSVPRAHEPTLPPLDMSRFPPPLSMHWQSSSMPQPLDSDSYVRHPNINGRVYSPHGTMSSASQQSGKNSQILHPVSVW